MDLRANPVLRLDLSNERGMRRLTPALIARLLSELERPGRIVLLESGNGGFCAGLDLDLAGGAAAGADEIDAARTGFDALLTALALAPRPVLALVDGPALGGGCALAAAADLVLATPRATFGLPEVLWGLIPEVALPYVARRTGVVRARLLALGIPGLDAATAQSWGLADAVVDDLDTARDMYIRRFLRADESALGGVKALAGALDPHRDFKPPSLRDFASEVVQTRIARFHAGELPWSDEP